MAEESDHKPDRHEENPSAKPLLNQTATEFGPPCLLRADSSGLGNLFSAWYPFLLHTAACVLLFVVVLIWIDDHDFSTGSPESTIRIPDRLFQTEVNGLISFGLVLIRLLGSWCTSLLVWRMIFMLLTKRGMTLKEIAFLDEWHMPMLPGREPRRSLLWTCLAIITTGLLWPRMFAAPLANSSVAWIPSVRLSSEPRPLSVPKVDQGSNWGGMVYDGTRIAVVVNAAALALREPSYAFDRTSIPTRRYFSSNSTQSLKGVATLPLPYFDVSFRWIDASTDDKSAHVGDVSFSDVSNNSWDLRRDGTMAILQDSIWNTTKAEPKKVRIFDGKKTVAIKIATLEANERLPDGSFPTADSRCPLESIPFPVPDVEMADKKFAAGTEDFVGKDCYILAEATIKAGLHSGKDCNVSSASSGAYFATCTVPTGPTELESDWLTELTLDTVSEVLRYVLVLSIDRRGPDTKGVNPWIRGDLEGYMSSMLTLAYHATWSSYLDQLSTSNETISIVTSEDVVKADVDKTKMWGWLAMNLMLSLSAFLVYCAQWVSKAKTVRNTTLVALTTDFSEITHSHAAPGLCNAVELSKEDKKLGRMKLSDVGSDAEVATGMERALSGRCCHRVSFMDT